MNYPFEQSKIAKELGYHQPDVFIDLEKSSREYWYDSNGVYIDFQKYEDKVLVYYMSKVEFDYVGIEGHPELIGQSWKPYTYDEFVEKVDIKNCVKALPFHYIVKECGIKDMQRIYNPDIHKILHSFELDGIKYEEVDADFAGDICFKYYVKLKKEECQKVN